MRKIYIFICVLFLSGCMLNGSGKEKKYSNFELKEFRPTLEDKKKLAEIKIMHEKYGLRESNRMSLKIDKLLERDPNAAIFFIENNISRGVDANYHRHLTERALRTLIESGRFEYLSTYWKWFEKQNSPYWFSLKFAIPATEWAAKNSTYSTYAKKQLVSYYHHGCSTYAMTASYRNSQKTIIDNLIKSCNPNDVKLKFWFDSLVSDKRESRTSNADLAFNLAESYFKSEKYQKAASWYLTSLTLFSDENPSKDKLYFLDKDIKESLFNVKPAMNAKNSSKSYKAKERIDLIMELGIKKTAI